jgi:hypothetical protein
MSAPGDRRNRLALLLAALTWSGSAAHAQSEAHGLMHGFLGMVNVIDHNTAMPSASPRFGLGLYYTSYRPGAFGPELAVTGVLDAVSVNLATSLNGGVSYQFGQYLSVGAGGSVLIGVKRWTTETLDPHYGGYIGLTWLAMPIGKWMTLTGQLRQQVLYDVAEGRVVFYPSAGVGLLFVPEGALVGLN